MAGYIINLDSIDSLNECIRNGIYGTVLSQPVNNIWRTHHEATFADYCTMVPGDNIYFFIDRKVYGIGRLINIGQACVFVNYPGASTPTNYDYSTIRNQILYDVGPMSTEIRWICAFEPTPFFFRNGVDMDDILESNPSKFRILRAFWKRSFIKVDDEESKALRDIILKRNQTALGNNNNTSIFSFNNTRQNSIRNNVQNVDYSLNARPILNACANGTMLRHEMALEAGILSQLANRVADTIAVMGEWDYISHQVIASPFKPIDYMDKMDIFGYKYIPGYDTVSKYLVAELKRDAASIEDIEQVLKYIDWVNSEYAFGDYSMIDAYLIASNISNEVVTHAQNVAERNYIIGRRPAQSGVWRNLRLIQYSYNQTTQQIDLQVIS